MSETVKQQRNRLAAGILRCDATDVQAKVRAMSEKERAWLTGMVDWMVDYEAAEAEQQRESA